MSTKFAQFRSLSLILKLNLKLQSQCSFISASQKKNDLLKFLIILISEGVNKTFCFKTKCKYDSNLHLEETLFKMTFKPQLTFLRNTKKGESVQSVPNDVDINNYFTTEWLNAIQFLCKTSHKILPERKCTFTLEYPQLLSCISLTVHATLIVCMIFPVNL